MKRIILGFISLVLLLILCACNSTEGNLSTASSDHKNKLYDIEREMNTYESVKCVTEKDKYSVDDTVIQYTMTNISDEEAWINSDDACFELHKSVDGKWKRVGTKVEHCWTEAALLLPPNETETREINLYDYFYLPLEEGEYRIVVENIISNTFEIS